MPGHSARAGAEYDVELARRLLAEAGYPDGQGLPELEIVVTRAHARLDALVEQWAAIGARVRVREGGKPICLEDLDESSDLWLTGWTADFPDPEGIFVGLYSHGTWPFYRDDALDELLDRARALQDQPERMRLYHEFDRVWVRERAALIPVAYGRAVLLHRPWVEGVSMNRLGRRSCEPRARRGQSDRFRSHTSLRPSSVSPGSTSSIVLECGAIRSARPPVAIVRASSPSSPRMRSTIPSTWPANP